MLLPRWKVAVLVAIGLGVLRLENWAKLWVLMLPVATSLLDCTAIP